jgi:hypothetical protein
MANGTPIDTGKLDLTGYQKSIQQLAAKTKEVPTVDTSVLSKATSDLTGTYKNVGEAAVQNFEQQQAAQKQQAEKAGTALEMYGSAALSGMKNIEDIQTQLKTATGKASESFNAAAEKADEYVQAARGRVTSVLKKLDDINTEFAQERSFAKAHAMQASVQAVLGSMKDEERNIIENYGTASPEYNQFRMSKMTSLATVQSNIHASYEQLTEQQNQTYLNAVSDVYTKSNMYLGFQEQQHVDMLKYSEEAKTAYELNVAQLNTSLEQMKMTGMENLANWIIETPSYTMDMTPLVTLLADLKTTQETTAAATALTGAQTTQTKAEAEKAQIWADYMAGRRTSVYGR